MKNRLLLFVLLHPGRFKLFLIFLDLLYAVQVFHPRLAWLALAHVSVTIFALHGLGPLPGVAAWMIWVTWAGSLFTALVIANRMNTLTRQKLHWIK